jgi:hypothetical protein
VLVTSLGKPVLCSAHPEWSATFLMATPAPYPFFHLYSAVFPEASQHYYDAVLEPLFARVLASHAMGRGWSASFLTAATLAADVIALAGFLMYLLGNSPATLLTTSALTCGVCLLASTKNARGASA